MSLKCLLELLHFFQEQEQLFWAVKNVKIEMCAIAGRKILMPLEFEEKLLDFPGNRSKMGIGFEKEKFLVYACKLANKYGNSFKNGKSSNK